MVRKGTVEDVGLFWELWQEYLESLLRTGGEILVTDKNKVFFSTIYDAYATDKLDGVVLFGASDNAVLMWGDSMNPLDTKFGRLAQGWGTYVRPTQRGKGVSKELRDEATAKLLELGFETVLGSTPNRNTVGYTAGINFGFEPFQALGTLKLGNT